MCEDPACPHRTRRVPLRFQSNYPICNLCEKGVMYNEVSILLHHLYFWIKGRGSTSVLLIPYFLCILQYTDTELYTQLSYFHYIFDLSKIPASDKSKYAYSSFFYTCKFQGRMHTNYFAFPDLEHLKISLETDDAYHKLKSHVEQLLKHSAYSVVNMSRMFEGMYLTGPPNKAAIHIKQEPL